jgi:imidazoleglycerol-phosphate dehydratase
MIVVERQTRETRIRVALDGGPISTTVPFLDHMLTALARYSELPLSVNATGDLRHHIIEDVAICVGTAVARSAPEARARFGERTIPMDDALVQCVIDLGGRSFYSGRLPSSLYDHWMRSFAEHAAATLHLRVLRGNDPHHVVEAAFKALGVALRDALRDSGRDVVSTKGMLHRKDV